MRVMDNPPQTPKPVPTAGLQIICAAMCVGILAFAAVSLVVQERVAADARVEPQLLWLLRCVAAGLIAASVVVPQLMAQAWHNRAFIQLRHLGEEVLGQQLLVIYGTTKIVGAALAEGAGTLLGVTALLSGQRADAALMLVPVFVILLAFPTSSRRDFFLRSRLEELHLHRPE